MELSRTERLILANQYEILKRINPDGEEDYNLLLECLYSGYSNDFAQLSASFDKPLNPEVEKEVRDILDMFRALQRRKGETPVVRFAGFDGNDETEHFAYASFLIEKRNLWRESALDAADYNTHSPVLPGYRKMLLIWRQVKDRFNLSTEEFQRIVEAAPFYCKP